MVFNSIGEIIPGSKRDCKKNCVLTVGADRGLPKNAARALNFRADHGLPLHLFLEFILPLELFWPGAFRSLHRLNHILSLHKDS